MWREVNQILVRPRLGNLLQNLILEFSVETGRITQTSITGTWRLLTTVTAPRFLAMCKLSIVNKTVFRPLYQARAKHSLVQESSES